MKQGRRAQKFISPHKDHQHSQMTAAGVMDITFLTGQVARDKQRTQYLLVPR